MTLRKRLHLASLALAAASLAAAGAMMPDPATAAEPTCLGTTVTINLNVEGHPDTNRPDRDVILGTPGPDLIASGGGPDIICAGAGDDNVNAGGENDVVDGGTGDDMLFGGDHDSDTLVYLTRTVPVVASVQGTAKVGASEVDTITDFETIFGGHKDDTLTGDDEANFFIGGDGDDTLNGEGGDDDFIGDDFVTTGIFGNGATGNGADTINGGSGNDTVDYGTDHASSVAVTLSVTGASGNNTDGDAGSRDTLKGVEDVHGTKGNDRITGNILANHLYGWSSGGSAGSGNDVLDGGPGDAADVLDGGDGTDTVSYASHTKGVQVDMVADQDNEGDEFSHVSHVIGSKFNDLVRDDSHRAIVLDGGAGVDTLDMGAHTDGVTVSFDGKANDGNDEDEGESGVVGKRDLVTNFENVIGTTGDDKLTGDAKANKLEGGAGNDKLYGLDGSDQLNGGFGADTLSGGDGVDTALYTDRTDPNDSLVITLDGGANDGSAVNDDTVSSGGAAHDNVGTTIENVRSGAGNDTITGSSAANVLYGGGGDDTLSGGDGNDTLRGDAGADIFSGGGGADTVTYTDRTTSTSGIVVTIGSGTANDGSSTDASVDPASTARDDVRGSVENVIGGAGGDSLTGSSAANRLTGGPGVDKLYGLGGNDALSAKDGVKDGRIDGGTGTDTASRDSIDPSPISVP